MAKADKYTVEELLTEGALSLGVTLDTVALERFTLYLSELLAWNKKINLTAIREAREVVVKHFLDSLTPYATLRALGVKSLFDIGAGGGFPGLPLRIVAPDLEVVLLDSVEKKVLFMRHIIRRLGLDKGEAAISAVAARVEAHEELERYAYRFDCVTSRAFASLMDFVAAADYFCRPGGHLLALKGPKYAEEMEALAQSGLYELGRYSTPEVIDVVTPFSERVTTLVLMKKQKE
jgi:16S rRNA (guanine527-N7)-methyltransferase